MDLSWQRALPRGAQFSAGILLLLSLTSCRLSAPPAQPEPPAPASAPEPPGAERPEPPPPPPSPPPQPVEEGEAGEWETAGEYAVEGELDVGYAAEGESGEPVVTVRFPEFPWPPPKASATEEIPGRFFDHLGPSPVLGDVAAELLDALAASGYLQKSFYAAPRGFALATQLEQIRADGQPKDPPDRWQTVTTPPRGIRELLRGIFRGNPGRYRVVVFLVTPVPFHQTPEGVSREIARAWLTGGLNKLPPEVAARTFTSDFTITALIYEFEQVTLDSEPRLNDPSTLSGRRHLRGSGLWTALVGAGQ